MRLHVPRTVAALFSTLLLLVAPTRPAGAGQDISIGGTTNLAPLLIKAAADYENSHPGVTISVSSTSSGAGIASLKNHDIDVAMSDVAVDDDDFSDNVLAGAGRTCWCNQQ